MTVANTSQREHIGKTHRISRAKKGLAKCSCCQETFETTKKLQDHVNNEDCPIRCSECSEVFHSKPARKTHHDEKQSHRGTTLIDPAYIDDEKYAEMKGRLKEYTDCLRKGKRIAQEGLEQWISDNTEVFMAGRDPDINPQLQLGQWYITFATLFPRVAVPKHPFYDDATSQNQVVDTAMFIWRKIVEIQQKTVGPLPTDLEESLRVHEDIVRQAMDVAASTKILPEALGKLYPPELTVGADFSNYNGPFSQKFLSRPHEGMFSDPMQSGLETPALGQQTASFGVSQSSMQPYNTSVVNYQYPMVTAMPSSLNTNSAYNTQQYNVPAPQPNYQRIPDSGPGYPNLQGFTPNFQVMDPTSAPSLPVQGAKMFATSQDFSYGQGSGQTGFDNGHPPQNSG